MSCYKQAALRYAYACWANAQFSMWCVSAMFMLTYSLLFGRWIESDTQ